jgi:hypothetical protein
MRWHAADTGELYPQQVVHHRQRLRRNARHQRINARKRSQCGFSLLRFLTQRLHAALRDFSPLAFLFAQKYRFRCFARPARSVFIKRRARARIRHHRVGLRARHHRNFCIALCIGISGTRAYARRLRYDRDRRNDSQRLSLLSDFRDRLRHARIELLNQSFFFSPLSAAAIDSGD